MNTFFLIWQDPESRQWHPVGRLDRVNDTYIFGYTKGSLDSVRFLPFGTLSDQSAIYVSNALFPIFANRTINERRPEFRRYAAWSGMDNSDQVDPLLLMARLGGKRATDAIQVYPVPERTHSGEYSTVFFSHGISHLPSFSRISILDLKEGTRLFPLLDIQNEYDPDAVALRTPDPVLVAGYLPRYLAQDVQKLTNQPDAKLEIWIKRLNRDAPPQFQLLCEARSNWPKEFVPCGGPDFETIKTYDPQELARDFLVNNPKSNESAQRFRRLR